MQVAGKGKTEKTQAKKSQRQLDADESALAQSKRKGPRTSRRLQENEEGCKKRSYSCRALYSVCLFIFGFHATPTLTEENELIAGGGGVWGVGEVRLVSTNGKVADFVYVRGSCFLLSPF